MDFATCIQDTRYTLPDVTEIQTQFCHFHEYIGPIEFEEPPIDLENIIHIAGRLGEIFAHKLTREDDYYAATWVVTEEKGHYSWARCKRHDRHPDQLDHAGEVLSLRRNQFPAWITERTAIKYFRRDACSGIIDGHL